jgi:hypothetical protein
MSARDAGRFSASRQRLGWTCGCGGKAMSVGRFDIIANNLNVVEISIYVIFA